MEKNCCAAYLRRVKRALRCTGADKRRLMAGLEAELAEDFPEGCAPTMAELVRQLGDPKELARELEAVLPPEALERARRRRRLLLGLTFVVCAVVIAILASNLIWVAMHDIKYIDTQITYLS